ncbi:hypothetical protein KEJ43_00920 [Candidatus Bathyarchaeota archaeon]|nr:hypothetical protein [Candidatus Bathyarchaeota archaeon]
MSALRFRNTLFSLLVEELGTYIPQFKPYTLDYQMVIYASKDLEVWLKVKMNTDDNRVIYERLEENFRSKPRDLRISINFWAGMWLKKWRERVRILSTRFKMPPDHIEKIRKARKLYQNIDYKSELKSMAVKKLVDNGEICMIEPIAENLIVEEIARRIRKDDKSLIPAALDPLSIYSSVGSRISMLPKERGPLIYLNIKPTNIF